MKELKKYDLAFLPTMVYVKGALEEANTLSKYLLELIDFGNGHFFTYLPENANQNEIYNFEKGGISSNTYLETAKLIFDNMNKNNGLVCIIDDVIRDPSDKNIDSFRALNMFHGDEVYYIITHKIAKVENILRCLHETDAIWHSLCVLTETNFIDMHSSGLNEEKIKEICLATKTIIIGSYDGEGYVFWEREQ